MYIGIDLGGTKIAAGLANKQGRILTKIELKTKTSKKDIIQQLVEVIDLLVAKAGKKKIKGIGIGFPGQVDKNGKIFNVPNVPALLGVNIIKELSAKRKYKYVVENDANAAALAELKYGAGQKFKDFIYLTISTGIGGGIVINRKLYRGFQGTAGEVGHMIIIPDGPACGCGNKGCWETVGSGTALANMAKARILSGVVSKIKDIAGSVENINGEAIVAAAKQQDALALELLDVNAFYNALGITNLVNILNPQAIIIGGGLSYNGDYFFKPLEKCLKMFRLCSANGKVKILKAGCRKDSGLLGALALVVK